MKRYEIMKEYKQMHPPNTMDVPRMDIDSHKVAKMMWEEILNTGQMFDNKDTDLMYNHYIVDF